MQMTFLARRLMVIVHAAAYQVERPFRSGEQFLRLDQVALTDHTATGGRKGGLLPGQRGGVIWPPSCRSWHY